MTRNEDYRNTEYCSALNNVVQKKRALENEIKSAHPQVRVFYNQVHIRANEYHDKFAQIYNYKCAYCGASCGLLPIECFEIDHFLNQASFSNTTDGKAEAGKIDNLVWACISCNRGKSGIIIKDKYTDLLNVDNGNIAKVFTRDKLNYIRINNLYENDEFLHKFYDALYLGHERRRLDYLLLQMEGKFKVETNEKKKSKLSEGIYILLKKRNSKTVTFNGKI